MLPEWEEDFGQRNHDESFWNSFHREADKMAEKAYLKELEGLKYGVQQRRMPEELTQYDKDFLTGCKISIDNW